MGLVLALTGVVGSRPLPAWAATSFSDSITGAEYYATSTEGRFTGTARGSLPGTWNAVVDHTALDLAATPTATIIGGDVALATVVNGWPAVVRGVFSGGTVQVTNKGPHCTDQTFDVVGTLTNVGTSSSASGTGTFSAVLTPPSAL
jgi:hypothetical protein